MGYGSYSHDAHVAMTTGRASASAEQLFQQGGCHPTMAPYGLRKREARDSADHPNTTPIIFALDVSGSMGEIPHKLATQTLPTFMKAMLDAGVADPQILFAAVGFCAGDRAPMQVGQFESTEGLMDQWLTRMYLEGGGGGGNESYEVAMYLAARHTEIDSHLKRGRKGFLFITGDEPPNQAVSAAQVRAVFGAELDRDIPLHEMVAETATRWEIFFLIPDLQRAQSMEPQWRPVLGDRVVSMTAPEDTGHVAGALVALVDGAASNLGEVADALTKAGVQRAQIGQIIRAITPFAASIGRDGNPPPA